ncbi:MAG: PIG-L deacetylase family protein [Methanoregula sp.]
MMKVLIVAAHPDDEVLGCGGTIARMSHEGHDISVAILGEGITSRYLHREDADKKILQNLHKRSHQVAKILGIKNLQLFNLPDNRFDTIALLDIVKILEGIIEKIKPECIFTHHASDLNLDHCLTNRASLIATRPLENTSVKTVLSYEVPSSTEWTFQTTPTSFRPNIFIDISGTLDTKIDAMQLYDSESRQYPHPRSSESLRANASRWGSVSGLKAAEAFELVRKIK